uniref:Beta-galactosidase n=1 Tax=Parastrongyloides trichosuri TaxID=131310 RepID=A0A0N4ZJ04_PARTI
MEGADHGHAVQEGRIARIGPGLRRPPGRTGQHIHPLGAETGQRRLQRFDTGGPIALVIAAQCDDDCGVQIELAPGFPCAVIGRGFHFLDHIDGLIFVHDRPPRRPHRPVHRRRQPLFGRARPELRSRLQEAVDLVRRRRPLDPRLLLHGHRRGRRILARAAAGRLARLQRLHRRDQAGQALHRRPGPQPHQGQYGHGDRRRHAGAGAAPGSGGAVLGRRRLPPRGAGAAGQGRARHRRFDGQESAAPDFRRPAPSSRRLHRPG